MGYRRSSEREVDSNTGLLQEIRKISIKQSNLTPEGTKKRRTNEVQFYEKERNNKDKSRNKWKRNKKINETKS